MAFFTPATSIFLIPILLAPPGWSQATLPSAGSQTVVLQLKVIDSDGAQIPIGSRGSKGFSFEVTDQNGAGVAEAAVAIRLPDSGASGLFADGSHSGVVYTDANGKAHVDGITWNTTAGALTVRVTATKGDIHAGILVEQVLVASSPNPGLAAPRLEPAAPVRAVAVATSAATTPADETALNTIAAPGESLPVRPAIRASIPVSDAPLLRTAGPSVSISNDDSGPAYHGSSSKKKWIMIGLAIAAGAGAAYAASAFAKGGSSTGGSSSISIGAPTVSVGHP